MSGAMGRAMDALIRLAYLSNHETTLFLLNNRDSFLQKI